MRSAQAVKTGMVGLLPAADSVTSGCQAQGTLSLRSDTVTTILVMSKVLPLSEVKARLSEVVDEIVATHERVTVTRNGRPVAVLVSTDDLEAIEETLALLSDPHALREIERGRAAVEAGDTVTGREIEALRDRLRSAAG